MKSESDKNIFEENLQRLLQAAAGEENSDFQERLAGVLRKEVKEQRRADRERLFLKGLPTAVAAAAVIALVWVLLNPKAEGVDWLQPIYGAVEVVDGDSPRPVAASEPVRTGQSVRTLSGSKALILMKDGSKLTVLPRSAIQIADGRRGSAFKLQEGAINVEAAQQRRGRVLAIETTPGAWIRTLGTVFEVRLVKRPDGTQQTRVGVTSGLVELESGGDKVLLGARTEGYAEEGQSPRRHLANPRLDEMLRLLDKTAELARQGGTKPGRPYMFEVRDASTTSLWTVASLGEFGRARDGGYSLRLKSPAAQVRLFTLDGREIPVSCQGRDVKIDKSAVSPGLPADTRFILHFQEVRGILRVEDKGVIRFAKPVGALDTLTLLRFRLPGRVRVERISPEPIETTTMPNRTVLTVAAHVQGLEVWE
jgi:ferric-dicitrate binding protein FerR (iron transport regulator)